MDELETKTLPKAVFRRLNHVHGRRLNKLSCPLRQKEGIHSVLISECRKCGFMAEITERGVWCKFIVPLGRPKSKKEELKQK